MRTGVCADVDWDAIERFLYIVAFDVLRNDDWIRLAKLWHFSNEQISVIALQDAGVLCSPADRSYSTDIIRITYKLCAHTSTLVYEYTSNYAL